MIGGMEGYQLLLHQPHGLQLPQRLRHGAGGAVDDLRDGLVVERQIPPSALVGLNSIGIERHIQHDRVDFLGGQPDIHAQQEPGIGQVGRQGGTAGDVVSFHVPSPFRVGFHALSRKIL